MRLEEGTTLGPLQGEQQHEPKPAAQYQSFNNGWALWLCTLLEFISHMEGGHSAVRLEQAESTKLTWRRGRSEAQQSV